jgi:hypothetical protein
MADWPSTLPQAPLHQGYAQREQSAVIRSQMGYGPAKVRRLTTAAIQPVNASMVLNDTQKQTLKVFYTTTTKGGAIRFNWINFLDDPDGAVNDTEFRFTSPIQWSSRGPNLWLAVMNLEILP